MEKKDKEFLQELVKANKFAEEEIRKQKRDQQKERVQLPRVELKATYNSISDMFLDEMFQKHAGTFYSKEFYRARYKPRYKKYREGFLLKLNIADMDTDTRITVLDHGLMLKVEQGYDGVSVDLFGNNYRTQVIRHNKDYYMEFHPSSIGMILLGAVIAIHYKSEVMLNEMILYHVSQFFSCQLQVGDIDLAGADEIVKRAYATITVDDCRLINRHLLLAGPPGCGKSMIAKTLVDMTPDWVHVNISVDQKWEVMIPLLNDVVKRCDKKLMILVDEIDEIGLNRDVSRDRVYQLLRLLDGIQDMRNVKFVATTNRPGDLDIALLRPGRFGPIFLVNPPTAAQFELIVRYYTEKFKAKVDVMEIVKHQDSLTGCDIRTAFEDCIIYGEEMNTENVVRNLLARGVENSFNIKEKKKYGIYTGKE